MIFLFNALYRCIVFKLIMSIDNCVLKFKLKPFFQKLSDSITIYACLDTIVNLNVYTRYLKKKVFPQNFTVYRKC